MTQNNNNVLQDPFRRFAEIYAQVQKVVVPEPSAMVLATVSAEGRPSARVVLLKGFDDRGFVFFTNLESRKGRELQANSFAALCFHWPPLEQQVRIEGRVASVTDAEADAYFASRPRGAQIGAWASRQSQALTTREKLEAQVRSFEAKFAGSEVPRPPFWSGFRVIPERMEFWQSRASRLHDRTVYTRQNDTWVIEKLYP